MPVPIAFTVSLTSETLLVKTIEADFAPNAVGVKVTKKVFVFSVSSCAEVGVIVNVGSDEVTPVILSES